MNVILFSAKTTVKPFCEYFVKRRPVSRRRARADC
jgi:hypothetical protein